MQEKIVELHREVTNVTREKETIVRSNEATLRNKVKSFEEEKLKMSHYIEELKDQSELLSKKIVVLEENHLRKDQQAPNIKEY